MLVGRRSVSARGKRRRIAVVSTPLAALLLAACQANPGAAPTVEKPTTETSRSTQPTKPPAEEMLQIHVGVDAFSGNLNPHLTGNVNPVVSAIADLTLPSMYERKGEELVPNPVMASKIEPNDPHAPTEVTYTLNPAAQWSDGTPMTVGDFRYLRDAIVKEPVAGEAAAYRMISDIKPIGAHGITVKFSKPFVGWKQLFRHLLPSHIYRAEGQSFATMMDNSSAASGGAYRVASVDSGRGRVELKRNDRYWGEVPAATDTLILDQVSDLSTGMQMMRTEQMQILAKRPEQITSLALDSLPEVEHRKISRGVDLSMMVNTQSSAMSDVEQRRRIVSALDPKKIAQITTERIDVELPNEPAIRANAERAGMIEDMKPRPEGKQRSGNTHGSNKGPARGLGEMDGAGEIVVGAPTDEPQAVTASRVIADQLRAQGIDARSLSKPPAELFETDIAEGAVDIVVGWQRSPHTAADYLNQFQCVEDSQGQWTPEAGNVTGLCDAELLEALGGVAEGKTLMRNQRQVIDQRIAEANVIIPLFRDEQTIAVGPTVEGADSSLQDWVIDPYSGVFASAPTWQKKEGSAPNAPLEGE